MSTHSTVPGGAQQGGNQPMNIQSAGGAAGLPPPIVSFDKDKGKLLLYDGATKTTKVLVAKRGNVAITDIGELQKIASMFKGVTANVSLAQNEHILLDKDKIDVLDSKGQSKASTISYGRGVQKYQEQQGKFEARLQQKQAAVDLLKGLDTTYNKATMQA